MSEPTLYRKVTSPHWEFEEEFNKLLRIGVLVPVEPNYEAAKVPATDTFAMFASKMLGISHAEAMQRDDVREAGAIIAAATIGAALGIGDNDE